MLRLKYEYSNKYYKNGKWELKNDKTIDLERDFISAVDDGCSHNVKLITNRLDIKRDRRDQRFFDGIKNIKIVYSVNGGGSLILKGNLSCDYIPPFGGKFYITNVYHESNLDYTSIQGVEEEILFCNNPTDNKIMVYELERIANDPRFVYNFTQFDEFMEVFEFYKALSAELNNNTTYVVRGVSQKYYFAPIYAKDIGELDDNDKVFDDNGILIGHIVEDYKYELLTDDVKDQIKELVDITIDGDKNTVKKIRRFAEDLYVNNLEQINETNARELRGFDLVNIRVDKEKVVISGETDVNEYGYLHLYDMGQKIKLESIENSLRLIHQGASGAAAELLEYIIGDKPMPSKGSKARIVASATKYAKNLDSSQIKAFALATDGAPVSLIKGPPGTGKTHVINAIVQYITKEFGEKVVISSQTHVAIDNVLDKLMENHDLIIPNRITNRRNKYSGKEIDSTLYKTWASKFEEHNGKSRRKLVAKRISKDLSSFNGEKRFSFSENPETEYSVIGATTTTSAIAGKKGLELLEGYDWLIIDEVSKCPITEVLRYLPYVKHIIMVGDDYQLAPLLEFDKADVEDLPSFNEEKFEKLKKIYEESVFAKTLIKAENAGRLVTLSTNYRSVKDVLRAYNIFYNGLLENAREKVRPGKVAFDKTFNILNEKDVFFVDVQYGKEAKDGHSRFNQEEIEATASVLKDLIRHTENTSSVSVAAIFPYAAQISKFQKEYKDLINEAKQKFLSFEIDTVDAFQGKEADIVLVNTVVTDPSQRNFLNDFRRINVSMSRARDKLFVFGNPTTLSQIKMKISGGSDRTYFAEIIADIRRYGARLEYKGGMSYEAASKAKISIV